MSSFFFSAAETLGSSYAAINAAIVGYRLTMAIASFSASLGIFISADAHTCAGDFFRRIPGPAPCPKPASTSCENCESNAWLSCIVPSGAALLPATNAASSAACTAAVPFPPLWPRMDRTVVSWTYGFSAHARCMLTTCSHAILTSGAAVSLTSTYTRAYILANAFSMGALANPATAPLVRKSRRSRRVHAPSTFVTNSDSV